MRVRALIFANGDRPSLALVNLLRSGGPMVVAADGGANHALAYGIVPHAIVGDLDSFGPADAARHGIPRERLHAVPRLDTTDLEKAVLHAIERGCDEIDICGASGGRADHALANLSVLALHRRTARIRIHDEIFEISAVDGSATIEGEPGTVVSLLAMGVCTGVTTHGLRWPLVRFTLEFNPRGIHNEISESPARVSVETGDLLVFKGRWIEKHA